MFLYKFETCFPSIGMLPRTLRIETSCFFYAGSLGLVRWKLGYRIICILTPRREKRYRQKNKGWRVQRIKSLLAELGLWNSLLGGKVRLNSRGPPSPAFAPYTAPLLSLSNVLHSVTRSADCPHFYGQRQTPLSHTRSRSPKRVYFYP